MTTTNLHWLLLFLLFTCLHRAGQVPALVRGGEGPCNYNNEEKNDYEDDDYYDDDKDNDSDDYAEYLLLLVQLFTCFHRAWQFPALIIGGKVQCTNDDNDEDDDVEDNNNDKKIRWAVAALTIALHILRICLLDHNVKGSI